MSEAEQEETTSNGQSRVRNQIAWARFYLTKAGLIDGSRRGVWTLTEAGRTTELDADAVLALFKSVQQKFPRKPSENGDGGSLITFRVLFQCKWFGNMTSVTPSHVRDFRGAMQGRADNKGLIMTIGNFTVQAKQEASAWRACLAPRHPPRRTRSRGPTRGAILWLSLEDLSRHPHVPAPRSQRRPRG